PPWRQGERRARNSSRLKDGGRQARPHLLRITRTQIWADEGQSCTVGTACGKALATGIIVMEAAVFRKAFRDFAWRLYLCSVAINSHPAWERDKSAEVVVTHQPKPSWDLLGTC